MKKSVLTLAACALYAMSVNAQTRLSLYEEFSGENCAPCAAANPGLWTLLSGNTSKALLIKYQSPIPSAGPIYYQNHTFTDNRLTYYSVPFAPYGRLNGTGLGTGTAAPSSPGHVANLTQADIDAAYAIPSPFNITVTSQYNTAGDSVTATITVNCVSAFAPASASLKLRVAMIEHLVYATAPGTNGETDFHNVVRQMYPDANGTAIANSWTSGQSQTYTIKGAVPNYVDKSNGPSVVAWIQNETDKSIPQAAVSSPLPNSATDIGTTGVTAASPKFSCVNSSVAPIISIKNSGSVALTTATIYYRLGTGSWSTQNWSGNLAVGASTTVTLNAITATSPSTTFTDSVVAPGDQNYGNSTNTSSLVIASTAPTQLNIYNSWENNTVPAGWYFYDSDNSGQTWIDGYGAGLAHNGSNNMGWYKVGSYSAGSNSMIIMPTPANSGSVALDFWVAYAQKSASNNDKLEVVYSTDCAQHWTSLWSKAGSDLATTSPTSTYWLPSPSTGSTDWKMYSLDLSTLPAGALLAFRGTAGGGNNMFIDDIALRNGPTGISEVLSSDNVTLAPNPATDATKLTFTLSAASTVQVQVYDAVGRLVSTVANEKMTAGQHQYDINTAAYASGIYNIKIVTEKGSMTQRLSVVK